MSRKRTPTATTDPPVESRPGWSAEVAERWNRFWFEPTDPLPVCALRVLVGLLGLYYVFSFSGDLVRWFGPTGILPADAVRQLTGGTLLDGAAVTRATYHLSYLTFISHPVILWIVHALGLVVLLAMTAGWRTRITTPLSLVVVLSYVHRAPMLAGQFEPILTMLLLYLCLAPCGAYLSVDRWLRGASSTVSATWLTTVSLRLIQIHLAAFYLTMALNKLGGETWWSGDAVWWLLAHTESRLVDLTGLHRAPYVYQAWTHAIVLFELSFALLIWSRLARPLLLVASVVMWLSLAVITGLLPYCLLMLGAGLAFVPAETIRGWLSRIPVAGLPQARVETLH